MKKLLLLSMASALTFLSCDKDSVASDFEEINGGTAKKLIKKIEFESRVDGGVENEDLTINYDAKDKVINMMTDGGEAATLEYKNDELSNITGDEDPFDIDELYENPYDAFEQGEVMEYDDKKNPISIKYLERSSEWTGNGFEEVIEELTGMITYDSKPNLFFYTLEAAGLIKVMDKVELNFSMVPQSAKIVQARTLFPFNNIKSIVYKNENNEIVSKLEIDYVYDAEDYPISAIFNVTNEEGETTTSTAKYFYK